MECKDNYPKNRMLWLLATAALLFVSYWLPEPQGLSYEGKIAITLMICAIIMWCTEVLPILITCALFVVVQPFVGVAKLPEALGSFANPVVFFVLGMFCFSLALERCGLSERIALFVSIKSKGDTHKLLLYLMMFGCIASAFIADIPVIAMLAPIALLIINSNGCAPCGNFGKSLLLGLPLACLIGGIGTPMGSGMNIMSIQFLKDIAQIDINFVQWTCIGLPAALVITFCSWFAVIKLFPSEIRIITNLEAIKKSYDEKGPLTSQEKLFLAMLAVNMIFWFTEPFHRVPIAIMAVLGGCLFFLPGIDLLDWDYARNKIGWEVLFINGATCSLGMLMWHTGAASWIGENLLGSFLGLSTVALIVIVCFFTVIVHLIVPSNPALTAVFCPVVITMAMSKGINPALLAIPLGFSASAALLLPIDPVPLTTYQYGYYRMFDWFKLGSVVTFIWVIVTCIAVMTVGSWLGFI